MRRFPIKVMWKDDYYWLWLCNIPGVGGVKQRKLLKIFESAENIYKAGKTELSRVSGINQEDMSNICKSRDKGQLDGLVSALNEKHIGFVHPGSPLYPCNLKNICDFPVGLYYRGKLPDSDVFTVAVVGSRACTNYGRQLAERLCREFSKMGLQIVSGLAMGIDGAAHKGSLEEGGYTCGVLGCGVDICYPSVNIGLYNEMCKNGCVLSEYPIGTKPFPWQFPVRNRIISGLADAVIVIEARKKSGSLITVDQALEQGKDVYVVPGRIGDELSEGCNELIKNGAFVMTEPDDIVECIRVSGKMTRFSKCGIQNEKFPDNSFSDNKILDDKRLLSLSSDSRKINLSSNSLATKKNMVYSCLDLFPKSLETIMNENRLDIGTVTEILLSLQLEGLVQEISKNCYVRINV